MSAPGGPLVDGASAALIATVAFAVLRQDFGLANELRSTGTAEGEKIRADADRQRERVGDHGGPGLQLEQRVADHGRDHRDADGLADGRDLDGASHGDRHRVLERQHEQHEHQWRPLRR